MTATEDTAVRHTITVEAPQEKAFAVFTDGLDRWWPRSHKIGPEALDKAVLEGREGGRWYERDTDGSECDWGKVLVWEPPSRLVLAWQITGEWAYDADFLTEVEVTFVPDGPGVLPYVTVVLAESEVATRRGSVHGMASVLLLVDVQKNMLWPPTPVPAAGAVRPAIEDLLGRARSAGAIVVHIRNNGSVDDPDVPGSPGWELVYEVCDGEQIVDKQESDAFVDTGLSELIPASAGVVVVGMQSEYCVRETSLAALSRGHPVTLVRGAHATYDGDSPAEAISRRIEDELATAGVTIADCNDVTFS